MTFVRYESPDVNGHGAHTGVFGLTNGLARSGALSEVDRRWWRAANDWYDAAYPDPAMVDPSLFDRSVHPVTSCWFRTSAVHLLSRVGGYLDLLDRYGVSWLERRVDLLTAPVLYEDEVQVVIAGS